ncbi:hypothetical protein PWT90_06025 [Aphanocladium album]|nr:hypothetical protein PWT90_06025 [Aphanocladium album]
MAERLIEYLAHRHADGQVKSDTTVKSPDSKDFKSPKIMPIQQPKFLPNPLLRQVRRRPAQLDLSKSIPTSSGPPTPASAVPLSTMSVREKLFQGISMDFGRLQASPASFDRVFPPKPAATAIKSTANRVKEAKRILGLPLYSGEISVIEDEAEEARQFEKKMRSAWVNMPML